MSLDFIKYAFVAGEISPTFLGRSDLEKYDLGVALARNFFVDYRGGLSTRPGTEYIEYVQNDDEETRFFRFQFAPNVANTYVILFGSGYIRFIQEGAYVLEADIAITAISQASPGKVTAAGHGFANGDWFYVSDVLGMIEVNDRLFQAANVSATTIDLHDPFNNSFSTLSFNAYASGGVLNRVYTVASPYDPEDLATLKAYQRRDFIRLTHPSYLTKNLVRSDHADWALTDEDIGSASSAPTGIVGAGSAVGTASVGFVVTAVVDGEESLPSDMIILLLIVDYSTTAGSASVTWNAVVGAKYYNVYRTRIQGGAGTEEVISKAEEVGYLGRTYGPQFIDTNIIPDFTITPPQFRNPFANAPITAIEVTAQGTLYAKTDTVIVTDPTGSGFSGYPIADDDGNIIAVIVVNGGENYSSPTISFGTSTGSGASATATVGEADGNDPGVSAVFQQRQIYAASNNQPLTVWGSRPGFLSNFDESRVVADNDSIEFEIDSEEVAPILHTIPVRGGLLIVSQTGVFLLRSGNTSEAVTPTQALSDPQSYRGCSQVPPLKIDTDLLYIEGKSPTVRLLSYSDQAKVYAGQDMSILSNHLFSDTKKITHWAYAQNPHNLIFARRSDGALLLFTLVKEQDVYAWTQAYTKGLVQDVVSVQENDVDRVYLMVKRYLNNRWTKVIERVATRVIENVEEAWCVDCGLQLEHTFPGAVLTPGAATGESVTFEASAAVFASGDVDSIIRGGGGKAKIVTFVDTTHVIVDILRDFTNVLQEDADDKPLEIASGDWSMDAPVSEVTAAHLAGQPVSILADGSVIENKTADASGLIDLGVDATEVVVGLGYRCVAETLPPSTGQVVIEAKRKRVVAVAVRIHESRGLKAGGDIDDLFELKEREEEADAQPVELKSGIRTVQIESPFEEDSSIFYVQDYPLPATILGHVLDTEIGDDSR